MAYKQNGNPFKKTSYISAAAGFDPSGVADELKNNPYAMMAKDFKRVQMGPTSRDATLKDQRAEYQRRVKANQANKRSAMGGSFEYTNPHTGEVSTARGKLSPKTNIGSFASEGATSSASISASMPDVNVSAKKSEGPDWTKIDTGRRQRAAETAKYGTSMSERERRKLRRQNKRLKRQQSRQQRKRTQGGFFSRLFG
tara:strand:- start:175 stop:768 length:594 start_codon:yes stop_codon:yes gene_type:complete